MGYSLERPLPPNLSVEQGLDAYLAENGFDRAFYDAKFTPAAFLGLSLLVPNTPAHRFAIMRHDLHHVATGFGTDLAGEGEISAWETRGGLGGIGLYTTGIVCGLVVVGFVVAPRRVLAARRAATPTQHNLFTDPTPYDELLAMTVGELRALLGLAPEGLAGPRGLHPKAPRHPEQ